MMLDTFIELFIIVSVCLLVCGAAVGLGLGWMIRHTHGPEGKLTNRHRHPAGAMGDINER